MAFEHPDVGGAGAGAAPACLLDLVAAQVEQAPDAVAIESSLGRLTFGELSRLADELAAALRACGGGPGSTVGILVNRSPAMVAGLLAAVRAGATYLPLDPSHPRDRIAQILDDAGAKLVLADRAAAPLLSNVLPGALDVVLLDVPRPAAPVDPDLAAARPGPGDLAYVIYTSGSTGKPKGVEITHGAFASFLAAMRESPGIAASDVVAGLTTIAFDIACLELWLALSVGARVALFTREEASDGRLLGRLLSERGVTIAQGTPATWRLLLASGWEGDPRLTVLCGGEEMTRDLADRLLPRCRALWNMYGPTETTVWSLVHRVTAGAGPVPIGRPIRGTTIEVRDASGQRVAPGGEGELYIGGAGVARGYRNRPDLTAERFLPDPASSASGGRLYRTGDLVRVLPDGNLVFLGRIDQQLKVRGFRVEAGEVESALLADPAVAQAVVISAREKDGSSVLIAHLVPVKGASIDLATLRANLRRTLPDYMIPSRIAMHASLPRTPSGKFDRQALARLPAEAGDALRAAYLAPRTGEERRLTRIWEEVLQIRPVGVTDNFFELGGHSLLAAVLFAEITREFGVELPIAALLETPTIEGLARRLQQPVGEAWETLVPVRAGGPAPPLFFVHGGGGTVLFLRDLASALPAGRPVYGLQSEGQDGRRMERWRVEQMAVRYLKAVRHVQPQGPYVLGGYCFGGLVAFEVARQLIEAGDEVDLLVLVNPTAVAGAGTTAVASAGGPGGPKRVWRRISALGVGNPARLVRALAAGVAWRRRELAARRPLAHAAVRLLHASLAVGGRVPVSWRPTYLNTMTERSERRYRPRRFNGPLHVIRGAGVTGAPDLGWGRHAAVVEVHEVHGTGALRRELVQPPHVWEVAEVLGRLLRSTQAERAEGAVSVA